MIIGSYRNNCICLESDNAFVSTKIPQMTGFPLSIARSVGFIWIGTTEEVIQFDQDLQLIALHKNPLYPSLGYLYPTDGGTKTVSSSDKILYVNPGGEYFVLKRHLDRWINTPLQAVDFHYVLTIDGRLFDVDTSQWVDFISLPLPTTCKGLRVCQETNRAYVFSGNQLYEIDLTARSWWHYMERDHSIVAIDILGSCPVCLWNDGKVLRDTEILGEVGLYHGSFFGLDIGG